MKTFIERVIDTRVVKLEFFKLVALFLQKKKHSFITRGFRRVKIENIVYLQNAASCVFCSQCGQELNLIGRKLDELTFDELYGCSGTKPVDPKGPKGIENGYELFPAS